VLDPPSLRKGDLRIVGGRIDACGARLRRLPGDDVVDLAGKIVMPGLVCAHTHLYSSLVRGMSASRRRPRSFIDILTSLWWRLDSALDEESIYCSALAGAIEAVKCGTTTLINHHASPNAIAGSLDLIKAAMAEVGIRGSLCYEVTDRGGQRKRNRGLEENERFISENMRDPMVRGMVGAHASFTLSDDSLRACAAMARRYGTGVHIHVAEDRADVRDARRRHHTGVISRLARHGVMTSRALFAHGVHCTPAELAAVRRSGAWLVHNPRSNMNNAVGHAPVGRFGSRSALGTDGFPADMFEEARYGFFRGAEDRTKAGGVSFGGLVQGGQRLVGEIFDATFGCVQQGAVADLVVLDYVPPTPLTPANLPGHFLFGMKSSMVESVMVNGRWVVWNRQCVAVDEQSVLRRAQRTAVRLWRRLA
jgi:putative selenium metabolism protein SsnA